MRALVQRVSSARVDVAGEVIGEIGPGLLILYCAMASDEAAGPEQAETSARAFAARIAKLRIFRDEAGKMNRSLSDTGGGALVVSQFTLAADTSRGNRPGFSTAASPAFAEVLYLQFAYAVRSLGIAVATGRFGADMAVSLTNDGPVTIWLES
jgi:D-aminoacyl-tRNA deacylase